MKNKINYDSEFCGSLPLHQVNLIQPYGYLLVISLSDLELVQVSENTEEIFHIPVRQLTGMKMEELLQAKETEQLKGKIQSGIPGNIPFSFSIQRDNASKNYLALLHVKQEYVIIEVQEVLKNGQKRFADVFHQVKYIIEKIDTAESINEVCRFAAAELKAVTGFDKVMLYTFDSEWNGTVMAEEMEKGMEKYIGLKFPASDIPRQARQMYMINPYRFIPTRDYTPVRLYPVINPITHTFIDLSGCNLRSVAAVHLEYMANMKIMASMSTRLLVDNQLWGLISCHHRTEKKPDYETCAILEITSNYIAAKISSLTNKENINCVNKLQSLRTEMVNQIYSAADLETALFKQNTKITELFNAGGAVYFENNRIREYGNVPEKNEIESLMFWIQAKNISDVYTETCLSSVFEDAAEYTESASGILVIPVHSSKGAFLVLFKPEAVRTVIWGGNPSKAVNFEKDGSGKYHPRHSFQSWKEQVRYNAEPWSDEELSIAAGLKSVLYQVST